MQKLLFILVLLLLANCTATSNEPPVTPTTAPTLGPSPTPLRAPRNVHTPTEFDRLYYPTDLNLVAVTGRPQFINAYADWCRECQRNRPAVHSLQGKYGDRVDFLHVDVENDGAMEAVGPLGVTGQTQYVLLDEAGEVVYRWFGIFEEADVEARLAALLGEG